MMLMTSGWIRHRRRIELAKTGTMAVLVNSSGTFPLTPCLGGIMVLFYAPFFPLSSALDQSSNWFLPVVSRSDVFCPMFNTTWLSWSCFGGRLKLQLSELNQDTAPLIIIITQNVTVAQQSVFNTRTRSWSSSKLSRAVEYLWKIYTLKYINR